MDLALGYFGCSGNFQPDSIEVLGPEELSALKAVQAIYVNNTKIQNSFTYQSKHCSAWRGSCFRDQSSRHGGECGLFSEESFRLPVALKNAPFNQVFKFFPAQLLITFSAPLQDLKNITPEDFIIGLYTSLNAQENRVTEVFQAPERVQNLRWEPKMLNICSSIACQKSLDLPEELAVKSRVALLTP